METDKKLYYLNGISLYQYKKFIEFLFGIGSVIKSKKDFKEKEFCYYVKKNAIETEKAQTIKNAFETFFTGVKIIPMD